MESDMTLPGHEGRVSLSLQRRQLAEQLATQFLQETVPIGRLAERTGNRPTMVRRLLEEASVREDRLTFVGCTPDELMASLAACYQSNATLEAISYRTGIDRREVRRLLNQAGVILRPYSSIPPEMADVVGEWYSTGTSMKKLSEWTGCSTNTVRRHLLKMGVRLRPRGSSPRHERGRQ